MAKKKTTRKKTTAPKVVVEGALDEVQEIEDSGLVVDEGGSPSYGTPQWSDYVMRQFGDDELEDGNPSASGCRRVVEDLIGPILNTCVDSCATPCVSNKGSATVKVSVTIQVTNSTHPACGHIICREDIADTNEGNTEAKYAVHASATAMTRAEGRILRKVLGLVGVLVADEVSEPEHVINWVPSALIDDTQVAMVDVVCRRCDMSVMDFINAGKDTYGSIRDISGDVAEKMLAVLNDVQQGAAKKPVSVGPYDEGWMGR